MNHSIELLRRSRLLMSYPKKELPEVAVNLLRVLLLLLAAALLSMNETN